MGEEPHFNIKGQGAVNKSVPFSSFPEDDNAGRKAKLKKYLTSVDNIEQLTGLDFLTSLDDSLEEKLESKIATKLWDGSY